MKVMLADLGILKIIIGSAILNPIATYRILTALPWQLLKSQKTRFSLLPSRSPPLMMQV